MEARVCPSPKPVLQTTRLHGLHLQSHGHPQPCQMNAMRVRGKLLIRASHRWEASQGGAADSVSCVDVEAGRALSHTPGKSTVWFRMDLWTSSLSASTPPPPMFPNCLNTTLHTLIRSLLCPHSHGPSASPWRCWPGEQHHASHTVSGTSGWYPSGTASGELEPSLARLPGRCSVRGSLSSALRRMGRSPHPAPGASPPGDARVGNMKTEHLCTSAVTRGDHCRQQEGLPGLPPNKFWLDARGVGCKSPGLSGEGTTTGPFKK